MDYIPSFLNYLEYEKRYSKCTVVSYHTDLGQFREFFLEHAAREDIVAAAALDIRDWIIWLYDSKVSARSINRKISTLKSFYKYLLRTGVISKNPASEVDSLKIPKKLPVFLSETQMEQMFDGTVPNAGFATARVQLVIELFYQTGIRLSELTNLREKDIDWSNQSLKVLGKRNKERIIPVSGNLLGSIDSYLQMKREAFPNDTAGWLIVTDKGQQAYPRFVYRMVNTAIARVSSVNKRSPHVLRHTFATHMLNRGAEIGAIRELLGHANLAATQVYTHNTFEKLKKVYKQAHPRA